MEKFEIIKEKIELLSEKLSNLPSKPGIYQFKDKNGKVIYVGKSKNLRNRVRSYFQIGKPQDAKTNAMIRHIFDFEIIIVDSEIEAFLLEDNLIKSLKPKYNIMLRDDKSYPYVRVTNEEFPRIFSTRRLIKDGSKYFGPFTDVRSIKQLIRSIRTIFQLRSCDLKLTENAISRGKFKVCLDYHIRKCQGPCEGYISREEYLNNVKSAIQVLSGKTREIEKILEDEMYSLSERMEFEKAAIVRNKLQALREFSSRQKVIFTDFIDRDIFGIAKIDSYACSIVLKVREGKLLGKRHYIIKNAELDTEAEIIAKTIEKWYLETDFIPAELLVPCEFDQLEYITDWLGKRRGKTLSIQIPKIGEKKKIVDMANANANFILNEYLLALSKREQNVARSVLALQRDLRLKNPPIRMECFDNSHLQGTNLVSSLVVFENGKPKKSDYRKFKIKTVDGNDDFASMREVVERRYSRLIEENQKLPDLIIIDGGKGQLSAAVEVLTKLNLSEKVTVIGLAKRLEEIFLPSKKDAILLPKSSSSLKLLQQIRDEAHRFAITFHRQLREKNMLYTQLTEIPLIGKTTASKLLKIFGSVEKISTASFDELTKHITKRQAEEIIKYFQGSH
ncbi:MAG TPA: excinuclease ABC subunit UvrC [Candidatus Kapabacteria bacterium]|nr:excinuclease ABC subunit UvrC [Candidatus Kapabacteria bacterium]